MLHVRSTSSCVPQGSEKTNDFDLNHLQSVDVPFRMRYHPLKSICTVFITKAGASRQLTPDIPGTQAQPPLQSR